MQWVQRRHSVGRHHPHLFNRTAPRFFLVLINESQCTKRSWAHDWCVSPNLISWNRVHQHKIPSDVRMNGRSHLYKTTAWIAVLLARRSADFLIPSLDRQLRSWSPTNERLLRQANEIRTKSSRRLFQDLYASMSSGILQQTITSNTSEYHIGNVLTEGGKRIPPVETVNHADDHKNIHYRFWVAG